MDERRVDEVLLEDRGLSGDGAAPPAERDGTAAVGRGARHGPAARRSAVGTSGPRERAGRRSRRDGNAGIPTRGVGIDVGGTGIKAAIVELATGALLSPRLREKTPDPSTPELVAETAARLLERLKDLGHDSAGLPTGVGLPGVVKGGRLMTAANIDKSWVNAPAEAMFGERLGRPVRIINDADAAGIAEVRFGAGVGRRGVVLLLTIGTGIGSALFIDGRLVPNTEFGHLEFHGRDAETLVSGVARERRKLSWKRWGHEFGAFLDCLDRWFSPDLLILGGGVSKESAKFLKYLAPACPIETARLLNSAGIVGAAIAAAEGIVRAEDRATS